MLVRFPQWSHLIGETGFIKSQILYFGLISLLLLLLELLYIFGK